MISERQDHGAVSCTNLCGLPDSATNTREVLMRRSGDHTFPPTAVAHVLFSFFVVCGTGLKTARPWTKPSYIHV